MSVKKMMIILVIIACFATIAVFGINFFVKSTTRNQILTETEASKLEDIDCIVILGAGIWGNKPSPMLEDRLLQGISLYDKNVSSTWSSL